MWYRSILVILCILVSAGSTQAQLLARLANPQVSVDIQHPPALQLQLDRVFVRPQGQCAQELAHYVTERFVNEGVEVVDRQNMETLLEERDFGLSGQVDRSTAVELGKITGASTLVTVQTFQCSIDTERMTDGPTYISQTRGAFRAAVQVIDITTGRKFSVRNIHETVTEQNESTENWPVYPPSDEVQARVLRQAAFEVHKWFFPWIERRALYFFDAKDCGLKDAYQLLKIGNVEAAARRSEANLEACLADPKAKPKRQAQARYNLGMVRFIQGDYEAALQLLGKAYASYSKPIVAEAISDCRRAQTLAREMEEFAQATEALEDHAPEPPGIAHAADAPQPADDGQTLEERLQKLQDLYEKGLLTEEEYKAKKAEILEAL